ncbi:MAG: hypothetical protein HN975_16505 [Anaerolineae bacterium]|jgi:hypothetical protein|nr:hypothetical protein [Anaerolineae bacterium]
MCIASAVDALHIDLSKTDLQRTYEVQCRSVPLTVASLKGERAEIYIRFQRISTETIAGSKNAKMAQFSKYAQLA